LAETWTREAIALGFVADVGDLVKLVMARIFVETMDQLGKYLPGG